MKMDDILFPARMRIGRRAVMVGSTVAAAMAALPSRAALSAEPSRLVCVLEEDPPVMNPAITAVISSFASGTPVYSALTHITADGKIEPQLAERWEISADGKTYTFHLRKGVVWHDGKPFTSADVKFSIENANAKLHPWGRNGFKALDTIETPDADTVVFHLKQPSASLMLCTDNAICAILPKHLWEGTDIVKNPLNQKPVGTGPYKMVEYIRGESIRYVKNDKYFVPGQPAFDEVVLRIIPDAAARVAAFENNDVDALYHNALPFAEAPRLGKLPGVTIKNPDMRGAAFVGIINTRRKPYDDVQVRRAVAHAIDRGFMRDNIFAGYNFKMVGPVPPASSLYNKDLPDYAFDPKKAAELLDAAGYKPGADGTRFTFDLIWPNYDVAGAKMADVIQGNLKQIGIKVNLQPLERAALNQKAYIAQQFDMVIESFGLGPDPDIGVERLYNSNNIHTPPQPYTNCSSYVNPEVDRLFDEQRVQTDPALRKKLYDRIQALIWADLPTLPMFAYGPPNIFRSSYVTGLYEGSYGNEESYADAKPAKP
jgi:peptide/nickel transport system substrate-binding protein